jgi:hypothetical protein
MVLTNKEKYIIYYYTSLYNKGKIDVNAIGIIGAFAGKAVTRI